MNFQLLDTLRRIKPVVLNISNFVTVQDVANGLSALGASPIMSEESAETEDIVQISQAIQLNFGAFTTEQVAHIKKTGQLGNQYQLPVVVDPVAVSSINYRHQIIPQLLQEFHADIIRGNTSEIATLGGFSWQAKGIDSADGKGDRRLIAMQTAQKYHCIIIMSGATDIITNGTAVTQITNGTPLLQVHVGSGDLLSSISAAFAAVSPHNLYQAAQMAALVVAVSGELAAQQQSTLGPGTFTAALLDELANINIQDLQQTAHYQTQEENNAATN